MNSKKIIEKLDLKPHPEGGFYRETYRCNTVMTTDTNDRRNVSTAIYYLLRDKEISHLHRVKSDELWFFHQGETIEITSICDGKLKIELLGNDIENGEKPQLMVLENTWFSAKIKSSKGYTLVSCTVAPGFDFSDFELAKKELLLDEYPHLKNRLNDMILG